MSVNEIIKEIKAISNVSIDTPYSDYISNSLAKEEEICDTIESYRERLHNYSLTELFQAFKMNRTRTRPYDMKNLNKDNLIQDMLTEFKEEINVMTNILEPTGILMLLKEDEFYSKLQELLDNRDKMTIQENLVKVNINFKRQDQLYCGPMA